MAPEPSARLVTCDASRSQPEAEAPHAVRLCLGSIVDRHDMKRGVELLAVQMVGQRVVV